MPRTSPPPRPTGSDREALFMQWVYDRLASGENQVRSSSTINASRTTRGVFLTAQPAAGVSFIRQARLLDVQDDYLSCEWWNGTTAGSQIEIAKPFKLRESLMAESPFGVVHGYTYQTGPDTLNDYRIDSWASGTVQRTEQQLVVPPWIYHDLIYAMRVDFTDVIGSANTDLKWIMVCEDRKWAGPGSTAPSA